MWFHALSLRCQGFSNKVFLRDRRNKCGFYGGMLCHIMSCVGVDLEELLELLVHACSSACVYPP